MVTYAIGKKTSRIKNIGSSLMSLCMHALWIHVPLCVCVCVCVLYGGEMVVSYR